MSAFRSDYETRPARAGLTISISSESTDYKEGVIMDTMTFVTYCLAGFGGLVVIAMVVFCISLFSDKKTDKKDDSEK